MFDSVISRFSKLVPVVDFWSLRLLNEQSERVSVRQDILQPLHYSNSRGVMVTIIEGDGIGYAATSDLTESGLKQAISKARDFAHYTNKNCVFSASKVARPSQNGQYRTPVAVAWETSSLKDKIELLQRSSQALKIDAKIVDWHSSLEHDRVTSLLITSDGVRIEQEFETIQSALVAVANQGAQTQIRTGGGAGTARQGGLEQLEQLCFADSAHTVAAEALALLSAPECPCGEMDILLMPSQMMLQIHESIGHPLELDRILGDERNYAGTSFVTMDMFGDYQYGSEILNITFDPTRTEELASFGYDDDGSKASREYIIRDGILQRPLGGTTSQARAECEGTANARACSWNRPTIDRMANLNLEVGESTLDEMIQSIENGVLMKSNSSWSIDDSRNKFQFGCELAQVIQDGELKHLVRNPNYRGISATFWRNLAKVGNQATFEILGTPNCGKGEPNQVIHVGHASPACVFKGIEVFGGDS